MWRGEAKDRLRDSTPTRRRPADRPSSRYPSVFSRASSLARCCRDVSVELLPSYRPPSADLLVLSDKLAQQRPPAQKNLEAFVRRRGRSHGYHALTMFRS